MTGKSEKVLKESCRICGALDWSVLYKGPIRVGKFGNWSASEHVIWKCGGCQAGFLAGTPLSYESNEYRDLVDAGNSPAHFYTLHDGEQADKLRILGTDKLRGKVIADIGCGGGSFLDLVAGYASKAIAIDPALSYQQQLRNKGYQTYSYCKDALKDWKGAVDVAVSFAVIEHIAEPLEFLREIRLLLKPNGFLLMSTPNYQDWLVDFLPGVYDRFFFRYVHTWYFNGNSLEQLGTLAGFSTVNLKYVQRYGLSNALLWIRDNQPTGTVKSTTLDELDDVYIRTLEKKGQSDFVYAFFRQ